MVYIFLPPFANLGLSSLNTAQALDCEVWVQAKNLQVSSLEAALAQYPKARILLHPADAPLVYVKLPPLPGSRHLAAIKVLLEDRVLSPSGQLVFASMHRGSHRFAVVYCESSVLESVRSLLSEFVGRPIQLGALSAALKLGTSYEVFGWQVWADEQGAGAAPSTQQGDETPAMPEVLDIQDPAWALLSPSTQANDSAWHRWRWVVYAGGLCMAIVLIGQTLHWRSLQAADQQAKATISQAFKQILPNTPQVDAIKQLNRAGGQSNADTPLAKQLAKIPGELSGAAILGFEWSGGVLSVTVSQKIAAPTASQKTSLSERLQSQGILVRWEN